MNVISIVNIMQGHVPLSSKVTVHGWVRTRRDSKSGISFLNIYDGSCFNPLQAVINDSLPNYKNEILNLTTGCSVSVTGILAESIGSKQRYEIQVLTIKVLGWIDNPDTYPIAAKYHSMKHLRAVAHLRPRTKLIGAIARTRHTLAQAIHRFMHEQGFFWVSTPIITTLDAEGGGAMFRISTLDLDNLPFNNKVCYKKDFFGKETFLTVSGQLNAESYACSLSKIYTFGPVFRAEKSNTSRHLAELWMVEPEIAFNTLDDITRLAEDMLKYVFQAVLIERIDDMHYFSEVVDKEALNRLKQLININFVKIDYAQAIDILLNSGQNFENQVYWGIDLSSEHEDFLAEKYFKMPVVVKNYPKDIKAFYMRINDDNKTVAAMDILFPGIGEIIGGSQREERLDRLDQRMMEIGLNKDDYWWYRDLRRYGTVPHSGFGLGFERLMMYITGIKNIRDIMPFPRSLRNADF